MFTIPSRHVGLLCAGLVLGTAQLAAQFAQSSYTLAAGSCTSEASVCSDYTEQDFANLTFLVDGAAYAKTYRGCNEVTRYAYDLTDIPDEGYSGPYRLVGWSVDGAAVTGRFEGPQELVDLMNDADPTGAWTLDLSTKTISGGVPTKTYSALDVLQEPTGIAALAAVTSSRVGTAEFAFAPGKHVLEVRDGATLLETVTVDVTCTSAPSGGYQVLALNIPDHAVVCFDLSALSGPVVASSITVTPAAKHSTITLAADDCFRVSAKSVGTDSVTVRYCDATGACVSARLAVTARLTRPITPLTLRDSVTVPGSVKTLCIDTTDLPGNIVSVVDLCDDPARAYVDFTYIPASRCVKYRGLKAGGTDSTCIVLCDDLGFCDTTTIVVTTVAPAPLPDRALVFTIDKGTSGSTPLDIEGFGVRPGQLDNVCVTESGRLVAFTLDAQALEVTFDGLEVGTERACVMAKASDGVSQQFNITVHVVTRTPARDTIRIKRGEARRWCFDSPELVGPPVRLFDDCPAAAPLVATATTADVTCLDFTAQTVGFQTLCLNVCDSTGRCDLTTLVIEVTAEAVPNAPVAVDDAATVPAGGTVTVDVLANDTSDTPLTSVSVVTAPAGGTASFDASRLLVYVRTAGIACASDSLVYQICNAAGCAQAVVRLDLKCEGGGPVDPGTPGPATPDPLGAIAISQLLSPNADGRNDTWVIRNIERYPDNAVRIFNRWGARVFEAKRYDNSWAGDFQDGGPLPDGTYFYVVEIAGQPAVTNFLEIRR